MYQMEIVMKKLLLIALILGMSSLAAQGINNNLGNCRRDNSGAMICPGDIDSISVL